MSETKVQCLCGQILTLTDTDAARIATLTATVERLERERDLAIAHDTQPYPTPWAYDQACAKIATLRTDRDEARAEVERLRGAKVQGDRAIEALIESGEAQWCDSEACGTLLIDGEGIPVLFDDDEAGTLCGDCFNAAPRTALAAKEKA